METVSASIPLMHRISNAASSGRDLESLLHEIVLLTKHMTHSDACLIYLLDRAANEVVLLAPRRAHDGESEEVRIKVSGSIEDWMAAHSSLAVPLVDRGETIGVLEVRHREKHQYSSEEAALVAFIGEQTGGLVARAKLTQQSHPGLRRMEKLVALAQVISSGSSLKLIAQSIWEILAEIPGFALCVLLTVDDEKKELSVSARGCGKADYLDRTSIRVKGSVIEDVIRQGLPIVIPNIRTEKRYCYPELPCKSGLMSLLAVPMNCQGEVVGAIHIYTRIERVFSEEEIVFVKVVAGQAASAIRNARLMTKALHGNRTTETKRMIERAKSIFQQKCNLNEREAYIRLRNESRRLRRTMRDVAEAMIVADSLNRP